MSKSVNPPPRRVVIPSALVALILAVIALVSGVDVQLQSPAPATAPPPATSTSPAVVTKVDADGDGKRDEKVTVAPAAAADLEEVLSATTPAGEPMSELSEPLRGPDDTQDVGKVAGPLAADEMPGCRTRFVGNFSKRVYGPNPSLIFQHQTVSYDRLGYADQDALTAQANTRASGTSWHLQVGGKDGLCTYNVPLKYSAWTQSNANSVAIGIEVQAYGNEPQYCTSKCRTTLMRIYREIRARYPAIKMRRGAIRWEGGCRPVVVRTGIVEHSEGGSCAGGHADVTPWSITPLIDYAASYFAKASKAEQKAAAARGKTCNQLRYHRAASRPR